MKSCLLGALITVSCRPKFPPPLDLLGGSAGDGELSLDSRLCLKISAGLLVLSGDIELNPGPPGNSVSSPSLSAHSIPPGREYKLKGFSVIHLNVVACAVTLMSWLIVSCPGCQMWWQSVKHGWTSLSRLSSCSDRTGTGMVGE